MVRAPLLAAVALLLVTASVARLVTNFHDEPLWHSQWHLHDETERDEYWMRTSAVSDHLGVQGAWLRFNVTGRGVYLAVVDDGVDVAHPEFAHADIAAGWDYNDNDANPSPRTHDSHGTQSAGVATAHHNGVCGLGTAPGATLVPVRLIASPVSDLVESDGLTHGIDYVDIYSNSWGPVDDGRHLDGPGPMTLAAMNAAVRDGRNGRGAVYVWAAGNGRQWLDSCSYDGFASSRLVVSVGAVSYFGTTTFYSEWCPSLLVVAPSSSSGTGPEDTRHIATTQPHGRFGESDGDCCTDFGGTSAAAPMVAGVVALMLEARPELGWRDVQWLLADTARRTDTEHASWALNGAGRWYSAAYGFGVVNATAAVERALTWPLLADERYVSLRTADPVTLSDEVFAEPTLFHFDVDSSQDGEVEFVELYATVEHARRGDLEITLLSPAGTRAELARPHDDDSADYPRWRFGARSALGERATGRWTVAVRDVIPNRLVGRVVELELRVWVH